MIEINISHSLPDPQGQTGIQVTQKVQQGAFVDVCGRSGIGKTTFFRILAGLLKPEYGYLSVKGTVLLDTRKGIFLPPQKRNMAYMFQEYALFPNMTVRQNLAFAQPKGQKDPAYLNHLLEVLELGFLQGHYPTTLSGGQQQRVALARALVQQAEILLLDEPLCAVDEAMRAILLGEIAQYHQKHKPTFFVINHNKDEFSRLVDSAIVL